MQDKRKPFKKKGKFQPAFKKKKSQSSLEDEEIKNLRAKYDNVDLTKVKTFADLPLSKKTLKGLKESNYTIPTEIQKQAIPNSLLGKDILGAAITGSGKTLAFLIPVIERLFMQKWTRMDGVGAIIISPTRELAHQIFETLRKIGRYHDFSAGLIIGGRNLKFESGRMDQMNILICTPGRLLQHMDENSLFNCTSMQILVLDEADRCLDLGFSQTMNSIIENLPPGRQTLLFSATQTKDVKDLARLSLVSPVYVAPHEQSEFSTPMSLQQNYVVMELEDKIAMLWSFLKNHPRQKILVFMATCKQVKYVYEIFQKLRTSHQLFALYGTLSQHRRTNIYEEFVRKTNVCLFATDIASRGLDFPVVNWVVQLDCPEDAKAYIHRAGRTARHTAKGENLLVLTPSEEEPMLEELKAAKIPINRISIDQKRLFNPRAKMEAYLAANTELKESAQRAFVNYFKSIALMKNKKIFKVESIDPDSFARSLGLMITPRVRFLQRLKKLKKGNNEESDDEEDEKSDRRAKNGRQEAPSLNKIMSFDSDSGSEDDLITVKRTNHEIENELDDDETPLVDLHATKQKKAVTKAALAKKIQKKQIIPNRKTLFDDDGNMITNTSKVLQSEMAREYENDNEAGINIEKARRLLQEEDKFDKQRFKELIQKKHKEIKKKAKLAEKDDDDDQQEQDDFGTDSEEDQPDLSWLPDPDKVYKGRHSTFESDEEFDARVATGSSSEESSDEEPIEAIHKPPTKLVTKKVGKKRQLEDDSESDSAPPVENDSKKSKKKPKTKEIVENLSLNEAEQLAMQLLG
ncbi:probable ATP-dependent RNA helicase DDX10 [Culicoides brevitarsis]|uniref:probable ATP-dependent RNA helicase DDX10 n=1 Tax=Culicoides brevitarsis TaxID=469753 RepID=UPI00307BE73B